MASTLNRLTSAIGVKNSPQRAAVLAMVRLSLGIAQLWMAITSFVFLITKGLQKTTLIMAAITTCLTIVSRLLFRGQRRSERKNRKGIS
jgi:hypothetical protein